MIKTFAHCVIQSYYILFVFVKFVVVNGTYHKAQSSMFKVQSIRISSFYRPMPNFQGILRILYRPIDFIVFLLVLFNEKIFGIEHILHFRVLPLQQPHETAFSPVGCFYRGRCERHPTTSPTDLHCVTNKEGGR